MSNVLGPIVARYSLFFTLALSDSSPFAQSKHPRQVAHELVLGALERFQLRYHANATHKLRALIRNMSSASSLSSNSSQHSQSSGVLTPPSSEISTTVDICCSPCVLSFPADGKGSDCSRRNIEYMRSGEDAAVAAESIDQQKIDHHCATILSTTLPSPPPSPLFNSAKNHAQCQKPSVDCFSSSSTARRPRQRLTKSTRAKSDKIARRQQRIKTFSIATLLSITLTMILLSLLQNRRRNLRKKTQRSRHQLEEQAENCNTDNTAVVHQPHPRPQSTPMHDCQAILPTVSSLSADEIAVMDYLAINGVKDEYLSTWLERQGLDGHGHGHNFAIESPLHKTGDIIEEQSIFLPESTLNSNSRISYSNRRRTSSLVNSDTSENISQYHCYSEEECYQRYDQTVDHAMQLQYYPAQRFSYVDLHAQIHPFRHRRHSSLPAPSIAYGPQTVSADELAWKRHYFYQRQQYEEEERALRILRKKLQDQAQSSGPRQLSQDTVTRAGSLNRLSSPPLLSKETSRILGLCRSSTISVGTTKKNNATKEDFNSRVRATSFSSSLDQSQDISTAKASINGDALLKTSAPVSLSRKKTLKEHLTPPLRSLARHCSSRFGGGRPNSFAGTKSDPITECPQNRRSLCSQPSVNSSISSSHMSDFKPLKVGPETSELLRQRQQEDYQRILFPERTPMHRTVSLFRSKSTRVSSSTSLSHGITVIRSDTLPLSNKRNSRGSIKCHGLAIPEISDAHLDVQQYASPAAIPALVSIYESAPDVKERDSVKKQIASIFSLAWIGGKSSKSLPSQLLPPRAANCLSPLAVEAQDYVPEHETEQEEVIEGKIDSAEHFSFMLVPRSQYEFQPLTAQ